MLHLSEQVKTRDWYLYQSFIEIKAYGSKLPLYKIPEYLPMSILSLEYISKIIHLDNIHFVAAKKKSQFRIKTQIGPFIYNNRATREEAYLLLKQMNSPLSFTWSYVPFGVIANLLLEQKTTPCVHTQRIEIEKYMNKQNWVENTLQEVDE